MNHVFVWRNVLTYDFYYLRLPLPPSSSLSHTEAKRKGKNT
jgi:hypothetical protein